jgi:tight adherence protein B
MNNNIILLFVFFLSFSVFFLLYKNFTFRKKIKSRIKKFIPVDQIDNLEAVDIPKDNIIKKSIMNIAKIFQGVSFSKQTEKLLEGAGSALKPEEFFVLRIIFAGGTSIFLYLLGFHLLVWITGVFLGFAIPYFYMKNKRKKRLNLISFQLIETLGMMANSMRAGFSFMQSMQLAGKELPAPLGPEFERTVKEVGLGVPIEEVFESLINRLPNKELEVVIHAILAQRKSGGNLAELLETMEETVRGRIRIMEELKTLTAQGRMSAWVITLIPPGLGVYLYFFSPEYFRPMLGHPLGIVMLSVATVSIIIGWLFIQKIIRIEV